MNEDEMLKKVESNEKKIKGLLESLKKQIFIYNKAF